MKKEAEKAHKKEKKAKKDKKDKKAKKEAKEAKKAEEAKGPGLFERLQQRSDKLTNTISEKYPRVHKTGSYFKEVWEETFPNDKSRVASRLGKRKLNA